MLQSDILYKEQSVTLNAVCVIGTPQKCMCLTRFLVVSHQSGFSVLDKLA